MWEVNAKYVQETFGAYVDWEERFYVCPECGEVVYEYDWSAYDLLSYICPICGFVDEDEDEDEEEDYEPNGIDDDMGYDPYTGCYSDDC